MAASVIVVRYVLTFDEDWLAARARSLYDDDEVVPGEPRPGLELVRGWVEEARGRSPGDVDTMPWSDALSLVIEINDDAAPGSAWGGHGPSNGIRFRRTSSDGRREDA